MSFGASEAARRNFIASMVVDAGTKVILSTGVPAWALRAPDLFLVQQAGDGLSEVTLTPGGYREALALGVFEVQYVPSQWSGFDLLLNPLVLTAALPLNTSAKNAILARMNTLFAREQVFVKRNANGTYNLKVVL